MIAFGGTGPLPRFPYPSSGGMMIPANPSDAHPLYAFVKAGYDLAGPEEKRDSPLSNWAPLVSQPV